MVGLLVVITFVLHSSGMDMGYLVFVLHQGSLLRVAVSTSARYGGAGNQFKQSLQSLIRSDDPLLAGSKPFLIETGK